jgi:DNA-binding response OmpR family regulator
MQMMSLARPILTICGDDAVLKYLGDHLAATGKFRLVRATTRDDATETLNAACYDALLLDMRLPDGDGIEFCSTLRCQGYKMPIILLGDRAADADVVRGLDAGANDCITDITRPKELLARLRAQLRVFDNSVDATLAIGSFTFRPPEKLLLSPQANRRIRLTTKEADLLKFLHSVAGSYVTRQLLLSEVWGYKTDVESKTLDTYIYRLRKKMETDSRCGMFIAMPGGYRLDTFVENRHALAAS